MYPCLTRSHISNALHEEGNCLSDKQNQGFTLVELLCAIAIVLIITGLGLPNLSEYLSRKAESSVFNTLHHLTVLARNRAIKDNAYYTLCPSDDLIHCGEHWNTTIIVFRDINKNERIDAEDRLYKALALPHSTPCLEWNSAANRRYLQFKPTGMTNGTAGHFSFCDADNSAFKKKLVVSFGGRTSLKDL